MSNGNIFQNYLKNELVDLFYLWNEDSEPNSVACKSNMSLKNKSVHLNFQLLCFPFLRYIWPWPYLTTLTCQVRLESLKISVQFPVHTNRNIVCPAGARSDKTEWCVRGGKRKKIGANENLKLKPQGSVMRKRAVKC